MTTAVLTAAQAGLVSCETCDLLSKPVTLAEPGIARAAAASWRCATTIPSSTRGRS